MIVVIKKLLFFWTTSLTVAIISYYLLWWLMPSHYVFGVGYRMFLYHWQHPVAYIIIPCFFYGINATLFSHLYLQQQLFKQLFFTILIVVFTLLVSAPFGGMLWHFNDMQAGFFSESWVLKMITEGTSWGLLFGWFIILLSIPYNILGIIVCFFLTRKGAQLFSKS